MTLRKNQQLKEGSMGKLQTGKMGALTAPQNPQPIVPLGFIGVEVVVQGEK